MMLKLVQPLSMYLEQIHCFEAIRNVSVRTWTRAHPFVSMNTALKYSGARNMRMYLDKMPSCRLLHAFNRNSLCLLPYSVGGVSIQHGRLLAKKPHYPELNEDDLEEHLSRGSGPGGQSVNKTTNCVTLKHKPTGIVVKNHDSRSLDTNRKKARLVMQEKLDIHYHGNDSFVMKHKAEMSQNKREKKKRTNVKLEKLRAFKEREGLS